jgi:hypothetical protein
MKQTFHVFLRNSRGGQQRFTHMALDHEAARAYGQAVCDERDDSWTVAKVRKAPTLAVDNLSRKRKV